MSNRPAETMLPPSYGARNEASVLFRVDQLAGAPLSARSPAPVAVASAPVITSIPGDDEGVIDLKSLSSAPPGIGAGPLGRRAPVVVAPLFSEPPPMTLEVDSAGARSMATPMSRGKLAGMIAGALALVVFLGLGISLVFRGEERKPVAAAVAPPPPPPAAVTAPAPTTTAEAPKVAAADEGPTEETPKKSKKRKGAGMAKSGAGTMKTAGAKPKGADPCGCKGEFNCILACSAKGKM